MTIDKNFDPAAIETKWYQHWESTGAFRPKPTAENPRTAPYTIVNPPPNVTGSLHIGHALDNTLQDILIRHARLQGKDALWVVGTDHAGIATQMVVERQMNAKGEKRTDFSREDFIKKVWEWKEESGGEITQQLRRLGCSMDWENERFTMDEGFSKAVTKVFVDLYNTIKEDGTRLLYRDKRLVNWDPGLKTAISDLEVETREINGKFWHFKYPLEDGSGFISVATTRPETMLADMAVAVNPSDERYAHLVGKNVRLPITGRLVPIVTDDHADPELGSGAVKITPGHDFNDFEVGKRAGFKAGEMLNMLDAEGRVVQTSDGLIPEAYLGLYRFGIEGEATNARKMVVEAIDALGLLEKIEDRVIQTPFGDRSGQVVEPWLTDQWYVDAETLAKPAIEAVRSGAIDVVPKSWEKTYFNWMENIQPWCVSRQLWWGHRIPAWYCATREATEREVARLSSAEPGDNVDLGFFESVFNRGHTIIAVDENEAKQAAAEYFDVSEVEISFAPDSYQMGDITPYTLQRDPDVLDTWFSSALWPFGTLGWPEENPPRNGEGDHAQHGGGAQVESPDGEGGQLRNVPLHHLSDGPPPRSGEDLLARHYPGDVLISGFDILFFWNARMIMQGLHFMKEVPFQTLYLHGLVRAADGSKMSKSKGNTVDPLGLIDQYGADALRFFMAAMESQGRDIKMDESRVAGYRNFATKLWNAARFAQSNGIRGSDSVSAPKAELAVNKWIIGEVVETVEKLNKAFAELRFDGMADAIYHFVWDEFCDRYLEAIKVDLREDTTEAVEAQDIEAQAGSGGRRLECQIVAGWALDQILVMLHPFMPFVTEEIWHSMALRERNLIVSCWPNPQADVDPEAKSEVIWIEGLIHAIRQTRNDLGISPKIRLQLNCKDVATDKWQWLRRNMFNIGRRANVLVNVETPSEVLGSSQVGAELLKLNDPKLRLELFAQRMVQIPYDGCLGLLDPGTDFDLSAERSRITKAIAAITKERDALAGRLGNASFVEKAKPEAVEKARADHAEKSAEAERLAAALARLG